MCFDEFKYHSIDLYNDYIDSLNGINENKVWDLLRKAWLGRPNHICLGIIFKSDEGFLYSYKLDFKLKTDQDRGDPQALAQEVQGWRITTLKDLVSKLEDNVSLPAYKDKFNFIDISTYITTPPFEDKNYVRPDNL